MVADLILKMLNLPKVTFSVSALAPGDTFELRTHFGPLLKKVSFRFLILSMLICVICCLHVYQVSLNTNANKSISSP